jgi:hypothetical protein
MYDIARVAELSSVKRDSVKRRSMKRRSMNSMNSMSRSVIELGSRAANYQYRGVIERPSR